MRLLLMTGLLAGGAVALYLMRDKPMVRERTEQVKRTASDVGGVVSHAASDLRETTMPHDTHQQAA